MANFRPVFRVFFAGKEKMVKDKQTIQAYLPTKYAQAIKKEAECDSRSISDFVRLLLIDYVNTNFLLEKFNIQ